ncbi:T9SS type A sorting domain-containing protein [Sabulilitoribacter arenilitoris]|uniref:T9SS type A sorting domain-containing protein n=1 Tax=Wocania arenilitoris TaxID=2044858 RepID=A0AAE3EM47_9FLAO|nr:T9SS type A sorting domain-containing protein [Wocania arenilitoris]MCF7566972.1 T9SS type A sorting domain-containing protein [Wocania arenilitoris]
MKKITLLMVLLFSLVFTKNLLAQKMLKQIPLEQQIDNSSLVVEGKVIAKKSFWDDNYHNIYTKNTVEIYKVFKGEQSETIEVITLGGTIGDKALIVFPRLELRRGDVGIFTLYNNDIPVELEAKSSNKKYRTYSSLQGFYKYNLYEDVAVNPFSKKKGISNSFYNEIMNYTKSDYVEVSEFNTNNFSKSNTSNVFLPPASITFTPMTASAGTKSVLTINGSGFGGTQGQVGFSDADDGGATFINALDSQVLTWSDTQITVEIPTRAGTGPILITHHDTTTGISASSLTITYAQLSVTFDPDDETGQMPPGPNGPLGDYAYQTRHINDNVVGGYTWSMQTDFFNDSEFPGAKADFESALDKWRCETKVNWIISGSATGTDVVALDGINVVKFDNNAVPADDLPDGVLGRCSSYYSGCGAFGNISSWNWHVTELDIVFDDETNWHFGAGLPAFTEYDFESVALHELGHGHQLGHTNDPVFDGDNMDDVMHYAISNSEQQRVLLASNISGASDVHSRSTSLVACSQPVMTDSSICNLSVEEDELDAAINLYPNPTRGQFYINKASYINLEKAVIYDISGRLISEHDISNASNTKTIDMQDASKGIYFVNIHSDLAVITKKIVLD